MVVSQEQTQRASDEKAAAGRLFLLDGLRQEDMEIA
jgi:hypothetical protein